MADYNVKEIAYGGNSYKMYPANLTSETQLNNAAQDATETQDRVYPVRLDANGKLAVNVPWSSSGAQDMTGATASTAGTHGLVPVPAAGDNTKYLRGDGTWETPGGWNTFTLTTPIGTSTTNSRQSTIISELAGAKEVIVIVRMTEDGQTYQHRFIDVGSKYSTYYDCFYGRVPDNNYSYAYDVIWNKDENRVSIRYNYKGSSTSGYPKVYAVMYR